MFRVKNKFNIYYIFKAINITKKWYKFVRIFTVLYTFLRIFTVI